MSLAAPLPRRATERRAAILRVGAWSASRLLLAALASRCAVLRGSARKLDAAQTNPCLASNVPTLQREEKPLSASEVVAAAAAQVKTEPQEPELQRRRAAKNDDDDDEEEAAAAADDEALAQSIDRSRSCPYLDTINRCVLHFESLSLSSTTFSAFFFLRFSAYLDFDFEKLCSVSMSNQSVYACLICGKYYQGWLVVGMLRYQ